MSEEFKNPAKQSQFNEVIIILLNEILSEFGSFINKDKLNRFRFYVKTLSEMNRGIKYKEEKPSAG